MTTSQTRACLIALVLLSALTAQAIWQGGLLSLWIQNLNHAAGRQIFLDLTIALSMFCVWMWRDAKRLGRSPWFWALFTFAVGSFGPLLYLLTRASAPAISQDLVKASPTGN